MCTIYKTYNTIISVECRFFTRQATWKHQIAAVYLVSASCRIPTNPPLRLQIESHSGKDERRLGHCTISIIPTSQSLCYRRDQRNTKLTDYFKMALGERIIPHEGVHGRSDKEWLIEIPCSHDACKQVITQSASNLRDKKIIIIK